MLRLLVTAVVLCLFCLEAGAASFLPLGDLPGGHSSYAFGVSGNGAVVVGYSNSFGSGNRAFMWTPAAGMVSLGGLDGGAGGVATAVSADGSVVVGGSFSTRSSGSEAFRWTSGDGMVGLGVVPYTWSEAHGVSRDGSVVVGNGSSGQQAWRWTSSGGISLLGGTSTAANAVSADGSVVVGERVTDSGSEPFLWTAEEGILALGRVSPGSGSVVGINPAKAISADGSVVVGLSDFQAFRWTRTGGMVGLGYISGDRSYSHANGVSADGSVVVGLSYVSTYGPYEAFVWTAGNGMQRLFDVLVANGATGLSGWKLDEATAVSGDGKWVVGRASGPTGQSQAFLANISAVPIPPAVWLFGSALGLMAAMRRKLNS